MRAYIYGGVPDPPFSHSRPKPTYPATTDPLKMGPELILDSL